jgi:hypothetical protein
MRFSKVNDQRLPQIDILQLYQNFDTPVVPFDCGEKCAPHNPNGKPFCCDICYAVPSAYHQEWRYLQLNTDLWHPWRGDECVSHPEDPANLEEETPSSMILLACLGPDHCQREYRMIACRQFPFFPYITDEYAFIGLTYNWELEDSCWVISNLSQVTEEYRQEFVSRYDELFSLWVDEMESYALRSERMRNHFLTQKRSIPILHRDGGIYLLRPINERLRRVEPDRLPKYGVYR